MEKKFYTDNFERLLKEKSDEFRMYPSKRVWHSIYNDLHPGRKWPSIAMSMILVIALVLIGTLNTNDNSVKAPGTLVADNPNAADKNNNASTQRLQQSDTKTSPQTGLTSNSDPFLDNTSSVLPGSLNDPNTSATNAVSGKDATSSTTGSDPASYGTDKNANQNTAGRNTVESMDQYIRTNQLFLDINQLNQRNDGKKTNTTSALSTTASVAVKDANATNSIRYDNSSVVIPTVLQNTNTTTASSPIKVQDENKSSVADENAVAKTNTASSNNTAVDPNEQKASLEDYALHNKSQRKKWKDRVAMELYVTPSIGYRNLSSNVKNQSVAQSFGAGNSTNRSVSQKPSLNLEAGFDLAYSVRKNLRVKGGVQLNYTSYGVNADQTNHPILTTLMLNDPYTGLPYLTSRTSTLSNSSGLQSVTVHNTTFQVSVPVGFAVKLAGNNKVEWHAGASIQPSFVFGGKTNFISTDYSSYVSDPSLLRKWNMNTGIETYLNYKMNGFNLQVGPQFRYQILSTYSKKYTVNENLYNVGIKVGLVKNF